MNKYVFVSSLEFSAESEEEAWELLEEHLVNEDGANHLDMWSLDEFESDITDYLDGINDDEMLDGLKNLRDITS